MAIYATALAMAFILLMVPSVSSAGAAASLIFLISFALVHWTNLLARQRSRVKAPFQTPWFPLAPTRLFVKLHLIFHLEFMQPTFGKMEVRILRLRLLNREALMYQLRMRMAALEAQAPLWRQARHHHGCGWQQRPGCGLGRALGPRRAPSELVPGR